MSLSTRSRNHKFLLDENVRIELYRFLKKYNFDVKLAPKSATDSRLCEISKTEDRIVITNDEDFIEYTKNEVFSVVWLRIPQNNREALLTSFEKLLNEIKSFSGKFIFLKIGEWDEFQLGEELEF